jgi:peptidoglycan hydrolase-like protein with peptidoglycan-binding domain
MRATVSAALLVALALAGAARAGTPGSADIAALQVGLATKSLYAADVDGFAGPATLAGLKKLPGAAAPLDAATRAALGTFGAMQLGDRPLVKGCRGWDVAKLQFLLAWHGFPSGRFDGVFGDRVAAALLRFQRWAGIDAIGVAGPATRAALEEPPPVSPIRLVRPIDALPGDPFGPRGDRFHPGVDYPAPTGTTVVAAGDGVVVGAGPVEGYGNLVVVQHAGGVTSMYAHLSKFLVEPGRRVTRGTPIGLVGSTGESTGPHLHFEVRVRDAAVDPATALYQ